MTRKTITKKDAELFHSWLKKDRETIKNVSSEIKKLTRISCRTNPAHRITKDFYRFIDEDILPRHTIRISGRYDSFNPRRTDHNRR